MEGLSISLNGSIFSNRDTPMRGQVLYCEQLSNILLLNIKYYGGLYDYDYDYDFMTN